jgi:uncharacterized membrane protein
MEGRPPRPTTEMAGDEQLRETPDRLEPPWAYRGNDLSRILALSDGVFAFAATLLVLDLVIPASVHSGGLEPYLTSGMFLGTLFTYGITFFVISLWWMGHHLVFSYLRHYDRMLLRLNTIFLLFIAILPFATLVLNTTNSNPAGIVFFDLTQIAAGGTLGLIWLYATGPGRLVTANFPTVWRQYVTRHTFSTPFVFGLSIPVAVFVGTTAGEATWLVLFVLPMLFRAGAERPR